MSTRTPEPVTATPGDDPAETGESVVLTDRVDYSVVEDLFGLLLDWRWAVLRGDRL